MTCVVIVTCSCLLIVHDHSSALADLEMRVQVVLEQEALATELANVILLPGVNLKNKRCKLQYSYIYMNKVAFPTKPLAPT